MRVDIAERTVTAPAWRKHGRKKMLQPGEGIHYRSGRDSHAGPRPLSEAVILFPDPDPNLTLQA